LGYGERSAGQVVEQNVLLFMQGSGKNLSPEWSKQLWLPHEKKIARRRGDATTPKGKKNKRGPGGKTKTIRENT